MPTRTGGTTTKTAQSKQTEGNTQEEMDLTDIYRAFHPKEAKYTFFSSVHGTFSKINHMIGTKTSLNKFK